MFLSETKCETILTLILQFPTNLRPVITDSSPLRHLPMPPHYATKLLPSLNRLPFAGVLVPDASPLLHLSRSRPRGDLAPREPPHRAPQHERLPPPPQPPSPPPPGDGDEEAQLGTGAGRRDGRRRGKGGRGEREGGGRGRGGGGGEGGGGGAQEGTPRGPAEAGETVPQDETSAEGWF